MAIPDFQSVMRPVLQAVSDGKPRSLTDVRDAVKGAFGLIRKKSVKPCCLQDARL